jgi:hypothetical protein
MPGFEVAVPVELAASEGGLVVQSGLMDVYVVAQDASHQLEDSGVLARLRETLRRSVHGKDGPNRVRPGFEKRMVWTLIGRTVPQPFGLLQKRLRFGLMEKLRNEDIAVSFESLEPGVVLQDWMRVARPVNDRILSLEDGDVVTPCRIKVFHRASTTQRSSVMLSASSS